MGFNKTVTLGPNGEKISETPWVDDGRWDATSSVRVVNADGSVHHMTANKFGTNTNADADTQLAAYLGDQAQKRATSQKASEDQGIISTLNAAMSGLKGQEAASANEGSLLRAQILGGKAGEGATAVNIDPRLSQVGQQSSALNANLKSRGVSHGTVGQAQQQNVYDTAQNTLNQATMKQQGDLAAKRAELESQKAMAEAKLKRKLTQDATGAYA